jgi:hypothetical protein
MSLRIDSEDFPGSVETKVPAIPVVKQDVAALTKAVAALKEWVEVREGTRGSSLDQAVTVRDLFDAGVVHLNIGGVTYPGGGTGPMQPGIPPDLTIPPRPTGFSVVGGFSNIFLSWDWPSGMYGNHAYTEVWRSTSDAFGTAEIIGQAPTAFFADPVGNHVQYYYWIRFVSTADIIGPLNATIGTLGQSSVDPGYALLVLTNQISETQLITSLNGRIDLIDGPDTLAGSVNARVATEATARADADSALATSITSVTAIANAKIKTFIQATAPTASEVGDLWFDTSNNKKCYRWDGAAWVASDDTRIAQNAADITTEATARADADSALATSISSVSAVANAKVLTFVQTTAPTASEVGDLWFDSDDDKKCYRWDGAAWVASDDGRIAANAAAIVTEATARANGDAANATDITQITSRINNVDGSSSSVTIEQAFQTQAIIGGKLYDAAHTYATGDVVTQRVGTANTDLKLYQSLQDSNTGHTPDASPTWWKSVTKGVYGQYTVKIDANGKVAGFGLMNDGTTSLFAVVADRFAITHPTSEPRHEPVPVCRGRRRGLHGRCVHQGCDDHQRQDRIACRRQDHGGLDQRCRDAERRDDHRRLAQHQQQVHGCLERQHDHQHRLLPDSSCDELGRGDLSVHC